MTTRKTCIICGKAITETFYVCMSCNKKHKIPYKYRDWPRWAKDLVNMGIKNLQLLRKEEGHLSFEVPAKEDYETNKGKVDVAGSGYFTYSDIIKVF